VTKGIVIQVIMASIALAFFGRSYDSFQKVFMGIILLSLIETFLIIVATLKYRKNPTTMQSTSISKYVQVDLPHDQIQGVELDNQVSSAFRDIIIELYSQVAPNTDNTGTIIECNNGIDPVTHKSKRFDLIIENERVNDLSSINSCIKSYHDIIKNGGHLILSYKDYYKAGNGVEVQTKISKLCRGIKIVIYSTLIPRVNNLLSRPMKRALSKTEVWGRLAYHGFDIMHEIEHQGYSYLIASKVQSISKNPSPSSAHLIRLNRVGYAGKIIRIYKIRTMYPYSEFLQEKVFKMNQLTSTGKLNEDFRITNPGKFYRKYWLDEFPQLLDWLRGEIKLVGIRAMSQHFFSLYPREYKDLFIQVKPGIISPIFDEGNDNFESIVKIEQNYLEQYLRNPVRTDIKYLFLTLKHIISGVRSN
jgi:lipopolysaccharide/colanic/teichoic acid biosynthesis glycosyltransferase